MPLYNRFQNDRGCRSMAAIMVNSLTTDGQFLRLETLVPRSRACAQAIMNLESFGL
jgi:hypothetical protein